MLRIYLNFSDRLQINFTKKYKLFKKKCVFSINIKDSKEINIKEIFLPLHQKFVIKLNN